MASRGIPQQEQVQTDVQQTNYDRSPAKYCMMQRNGTKVFGPPKDWIGAPPSSACELFIRRIPKKISEGELLQMFLRFGKIYQMRVPIDFDQEIRGYGYVRYTNEDDAGCAMELLQHRLMAGNEKLEIVNSCEKCCLFINNIPKQLTLPEVELCLRRVFPRMKRVFSKCEETASSGNAGHVHVAFASHNEALQAKKDTCPGVIQLWGRNLNVVWAASENRSCSSSYKTLFIRNVDMKLNTSDLYRIFTKYVKRSAIKKISKSVSNVFVDFDSRESAEIIYNQMQGVVINSVKIKIEWAKPATEQSIHQMVNQDYDAVLRLKCLANMWSIPVIIFGTCFESEGHQYATVMLRHSTCQLRFITVIFNYRELADIHSRLCEVVVTLIDKIGFPDFNYVFYVKRDFAYLLGVVTDPQICFMALHGIPNEFKVDTVEILDLGFASYFLSMYSEEQLLEFYKDSFLVKDRASYLRICAFGNRVLGTIMPKYRGKSALKCNLNDTQIVLALCYSDTGTNVENSPRERFVRKEPIACDYWTTKLPSVSLTLLPLPLTQSKCSTNYVLSKVKFGHPLLLHPARRTSVPPLYVSGASYSQYLKYTVQVAEWPVVSQPTASN